MIVVTTGTNEQAFDRLVRWAAPLAEHEELFLQYGSSTETPSAGTWVDFLDFDDLADRMREARVVVCHAGVGSIMLARRCGHRPVILPRRLDLGEAVDDHQLGLARRLHDGGLVTLVETEDALHTAALAGQDLAASTLAAELPGAATLSAEIRDVLDGCGVRAAILSAP